MTNGILQNFNIINQTLKGDFYVTALHELTDDFFFKILLLILHDI